LGKKREVRKTLISPKIRLLLEICLHGVKDESNYLASLSDKIDFSEGSTHGYLQYLLDTGLIESLGVGDNPPYKATRDAKELLDPILFVRKLGFILILVVCVYSALFVFLWINDSPGLIYRWFPSTMSVLAALSLILIYYPQLILKFGKLRLPKGK